MVIRHCITPRLFSKNPLCAHFLSDDRDAVALLRKTRGAHGDQVTGTLRNDRFRRAVGPFKMMDETDNLPALHLRSEIDRDFKDAGFRREQVILSL